VQKHFKVVTYSGVTVLTHVQVLIMRDVVICFIGLLLLSYYLFHSFSFIFFYTYTL